MTAPAKREIAEQDDRQEQKNERIGIEEHQAFLNRAGKPSYKADVANPRKILPKQPIWQFGDSNRYSIAKTLTPCCHCRA